MLTISAHNICLADLRVPMTNSRGMRLGKVVLQVLLVIIRLRTVRALLVLDLSCRVVGAGLLMWCQVLLCIEGLGTELALYNFLFIMGLHVTVKSALCGK